MPVGRDALEAGDDDDRALVELLEDALLVDRLDAGLGERRVGDEPDLPAGEADRLVALGVDGHGHQCDGDLLAGGEELVHLAFGRVFVAPAERADVFGELDQVVGRVAHGGDDDDDLVALFLGRDGPAGGAVDALGVGDTGAAEFLDDETHWFRGKSGHYTGHPRGDNARTAAAVGPVFPGLIIASLGRDVSILSEAATPAGAARQRRGNDSAAGAYRGLRAPPVSLRGRLLRCALLVAVVLAAFYPVLGHEFIEWDDHIAIYTNPDFLPPRLSTLGHYWTGAHL